MVERFIHVFIHWLPIAITIIILGGFTYVAVQQNYRESLNDPQLRIVIDAQNALLSGKVPADVVPRTELFDVEKSLATFVAVYDANGAPLESSASVGNVPPQPPIGVFEYAKAQGENRVTWQPNEATRIALVVRPVPGGSGYFVASGRNMSEVEAREAKLSQMMFIAIVCALVASFVLDFAGDALRRKSALAV